MAAVAHHVADTITTSPDFGHLSNDRDKRSMVELRIATNPAQAASLLAERLSIGDSILKLPERPLGLSVTFEERIQKILRDHQYVSFELCEKGSACHITRVSDGSGVLIHLVRPGVLPSGARYQDIAARMFVPKDGKVDVDQSVGHNEDLIHKTLEHLEASLQAKAGRPLLVNVSPQGYHENNPNREKLGLQDTGGQDKYINDFSRCAGEMGVRVINVNRAGPNHPINGDVREGMHYGIGNVDLLFVKDDRPSEFVAKEEMYPRIGPEVSALHSLPKDDAVFSKLAQDLVRQLISEGQVQAGNRIVLMGHYADGISVACLAHDLLIELGYQKPDLIGIAHSTGPAKERGLVAGGKPILESYRFRERQLVERYGFHRVDHLVSTSPSMTDSFNRDYGREATFDLFPGVDERLFCPRPAHRSRSDARHYGEIWRELSELSGASITELQNSTLIMEVSRTAETKGKDVVIRAFAESLKDSPNKFLIINAADPSRPNISSEERLVGETVRKLITELGIEKRVILKNDFPNSKVAILSQIADIYISGASSEPWGMSVQQAAAAGMAVISTTAVPAATEVLIRKGEHVRLTDSDPLYVGDGAIFFRPGDHMAAATAMSELALNPTHRKSLGQRAHKLMEPYIWSRLTRDFLQSTCMMDFDQEGKVDSTCVSASARSPLS